MVLHRNNEHQHWTLPGGAVEQNETLEAAVIREVFEETILKTEVIKPLFDEKFLNGQCRCFLLKEVRINQTIKLGNDPEDAHLSKEDKTLQKVEWKSMDDFYDDKQVARVLAVMKN